MFKRILSFLLVLVIGVVGFSSVVSADEVSLCDLYTSSASSTLTISGTTATCTSRLSGYYGQTTKVVISQTLQKKNSSGKWEKVKSWSETDNSYMGYASNKAYNLAKGTYRLKTVFKSYSGSDYETITKYSSTKTVS